MYDKRGHQLVESSRMYSSANNGTTWHTNQEDRKTFKPFCARCMPFNSFFTYSFYSSMLLYLYKVNTIFKPSPNVIIFPSQITEKEIIFQYRHKKRGYLNGVFAC